MELSFPIAILLVAAVPIAWWLLRRGPAPKARPHPLWFLLTDQAPSTAAPERRFPWLVGLLWLAALSALAVAATGPVARVDEDRSAVIVDTSLAAMAGDNGRATRRRLSALDEDTIVILATPGGWPRAYPVAEAGELLAVSAGTVRRGQLEAAVALAERAGASRIELISDRVTGDNAAIVGAELVAARLRPESGTLVTRVANFAGGPRDLDLVARVAGAELWRRSLRLSGGETAVVEVPYAGAGGQLVDLEIDSGDALAEDDRAVVEVPPLGQIPVFLVDRLRGSAVERILASLAMVRIVDAPEPEAVLVTDTDGKQPARAVLQIVRSDFATPFPLLAVPDSPLEGLTPALLAELPAAAASAEMSRRCSPSAVWLRAGASPAICLGEQLSRPVVYFSASISGVALPIALADLFAVQPLRPPPRCSVVVGGARSPGVHGAGRVCEIVRAEPSGSDLRAVTAVTAAPASGRASRLSLWPIHALLLAALTLLLIESVVSRVSRWRLLGRGVAALLLVVAIISGGEVVGRRVVFLADASASVGGVGHARRAILGLVDGLDSRDRAGVVVFAGGAAIAVPLGPPREVEEWAATIATEPTRGIDPARTDLASGFLLAGTLLEEGGGEVVLVSDGIDTANGVNAAVDSPALAGHSLAFVPLSRGDRSRLAAPATPIAARASAPLALPLVVETLDGITDATLTVDADGLLLARRQVTVGPGETVVTVPVKIEESGLQLLRARLESAGDQAPANDEATVAVIADGPPRLLTIGRDAAAELPADPVALASFDLIVLDDLAYSRIGDARALALVEYVSAGGTLLIGGGPSSFTAGGYGNTPLDRLLPLRSDTREADEQVALILLFDRSGSIGAKEDQVPTVAELGGLAARLRDTDLFGVISFDVAAHPLRPLGPASARGAVLPALPDALGGTDPTPALELARRWLERAPPAARRMVALVSDGGFSQRAAAVRRAVTALAAAGARVAVIAVGVVDREDRDRLAELARLGGGPLLAPTTSKVEQALPGLIAAADDQAERSPIDQTPALARPRSAAAALGISFDEVSFSAHLRTRLAPDASPLVDLGGDPLLAHRKAGRGDVFAFAADLGDRWSPRGTGAALRASVAAFAGRARAAEVTARFALTPVPGSLAITVELASGAADRLELLVTGADGTERRSVMTAEGLGRFSTVVAALSPGIARLAIERSGVRVADYAVVIPDPEHAGLGANPELGELASARHRPHDRRLRAAANLPLICLGAVLVLLLCLVPRRTGPAS